ncbi:MAG: 50S ribosomal protein L24 [Dehalococcoidales bacterium]|nr:50S ribosomal protein L24 [Dehalococcoidales bacterium]
MNIHKDDNVLVIAGKDKGKKGKVRFVYPRKQQVIIEGINFIKKHSKARGAVKQAGIIDLEAPLHVSNVMFVCGKCNKPVRVGMQKLEDGRSVRYCRSCGEVID